MAEAEAPKAAEAAERAKEAAGRQLDVELWLARVGAVEKRALKADDADAGERFAAAAHVMGAAPGDLLTREGMRERYKVLVMGLHPSKRKCVGK